MAAFAATTILLGAVAHGEACPSRVELGAEARQYRGRYRNPAFGFATRIPERMTGLDTDDPSYQRGFTLSLPNGQGTVWVYGEVNSEDAYDLRHVAATRLDYLRDAAEAVTSTAYLRKRIGGRYAEQVRAEFHCKGDPTRYGYLADFSMDRSRRFLYGMLWEGPVEGRESAKRTLRALEDSWKFLPAR